MAHYQDHTELFHYVPTQEWGGATRDYKKSMHKKLSFNTAREGRVKLLICFFPSTPTTIMAERKAFLQKQGEQSIVPHYQ
jgi:hypothetical protein